MPDFVEKHRLGAIGLQGFLKLEYVAGEIPDGKSADAATVSQTEQ